MFGDEVPSSVIEDQFPLTKLIAFAGALIYNLMWNYSLTGSFSGKAV